MDELKPCPFCGEIVYLEKRPLWRTEGITTRGYAGCFKFIIECPNPKCRCNVMLGANDTIYRPEAEAKQNAIKAWNRRAYEQQENRDTV